jgi:hypothetical protein
VPSITENPLKEKKPRKPEVSKKKSSDDEDDKPQRKPVAKRPKKAAFSDSDMSDEEFIPKKKKAVTLNIDLGRLLTQFLSLRIRPCTRDI